MNTLHRLNWLRSAIVCLLAALPTAVFGYESETHQQLTFVAVKQFSRCAQEFIEIDQPSALDTRYVVRANVAQAEGNFFVRMFRWNYYNRADEENRSAVWMIDTRFHDHFNGLTTDLVEDQERRQRLRTFGRILSYLQDVTSPAHVVPVFTSRWWRLSFSDRFDRFPLDVDGIESALNEFCDTLPELAPNFDALLTNTAADTIQGVRSKITGFPTTWESYWEFAKDSDEFGEYGPAGNQFGRRTRFSCGNRDKCLLLENDPLYQAFAMERHITAVKSTIHAMMLMQVLERRRANAEPLDLNAD
jgi:hypothetical protein